MLLCVNAHLSSITVIIILQPKIYSQITARKAKLATAVHSGSQLQQCKRAKSILMVLNYNGIFILNRSNKLAERSVGSNVDY